MENSRHEDLTRRAVNGIKNLLFNNEIAPTMRLSARELAKRLDMSPTPVIQALKHLHYQGILAHVPNKGYFVETNTPDTIRDIFDLRISVETAGLENFLSRITPRDRRSLEEMVCDHMEGLSDNSPKRILAADMSFHVEIARIATGAAGERLVRNLFEMLYLKGREVVLYVTPVEDFGHHHKEILDALWAGDIPSARTTLKAHLNSVRDAVLMGMEKVSEEREMAW